MQFALSTGAYHAIFSNILFNNLGLDWNATVNFVINHPVGRTSISHCFQWCQSILTGFYNGGL